MNNLKDIKVLIVEDEEENRDLLLRIMINEYNLRNDNVIEAENLVQAKDAIDSYYPNIILLDLNIPADEGYEPKIDNAYSVLEKIDLYNSKQFNHIDKIKTIIISGSIEDKGVQKFISQNKDLVFDYVDKSIIAADFDKFKIDFKKKLDRAANYQGQNPSIDYSFIRRSLMKNLEKSNPDLWNKMDQNILQEFEKINNKNVNEYTTSKGIIGSCGEIIEDVILLFEDDTDQVGYSDNEKTILNRLTKLSGRRREGWDEEARELVFSDIKNKRISRISQEYAIMAYRLRSQALHSKEGDHNLNKWFNGHKFNREDASIAINLIVPILKDYILYKNQ